MSITRIAFNDTATYSGAYTLSLNPSFLELNNLDNYEEIEVMDGGVAKQGAYFDGRPFILRWNRIPSNYSGFSSILGTLKSYVDSEKYVHFGTADYSVPTLGWTKVIVGDVRVSIENGGYPFKYSIEVLLYPEV